MFVRGVGAVVLAVPPVGTVYHCNVYPDNAVAVNAEAEVLWHKLMVVVATGATGNAFTVTVIVVRELSHPVASFF